MFIKKGILGCFCFVSYLQQPQLKVNVYVYLFTSCMMLWCAHRAFVHVCPVALSINTPAHSFSLCLFLMMFLVILIYVVLQSPLVRTRVTARSLSMWSAGKPTKKLGFRLHCSTTKQSGQYIVVLFLIPN